jgi:hypothetical protein
LDSSGFREPGGFITRPPAGPNSREFGENHAGTQGKSPID